MPPQNVTSLDVNSLGPPRVPALDVKVENGSALNGQPVGLSNSPSLEVKTQSITKVSSLQVKSEGVKQVESLGRLPSSLPVIPSALEIKTEAVSTTGPSVTSPVQQRSPDAGITSSSAGSFVTTQTVGKIDIPVTVTGTGSVTATPIAYTSAVTTTASTTTMTAAQDGITTGQDASILGKRIRRQSTKYEDYEQQAMTVRPVCQSDSGECCLSSIHVRVWYFPF